MQVYLVGGAVRDHLLGHPYQEKDYVVGATPEQLLAQGFMPVGKDFPVFLHPDTKDEYALARTERKSGQGYHGFEFHTDSSVTLEEDLIRRDLTINAMAMDEQGQVYDPYQGRQDLKIKFYAMFPMPLLKIRFVYYVLPVLLLAMLLTVLRLLKRP